MSGEFVRERLFKPFDTTKGPKGMGIGAYQVREYVRSIGGRVDVASVEGQGTRITLRVPLSGPPQSSAADADTPAAAPALREIATHHAVRASPDCLRRTLCKRLRAF